MAVVVGEKPSGWVLILVMLLVVVAVAILVFALTGGRGTVLVVAIPGFPVESLLIGLMVGLLLIVFRRRSSKVVELHTHQREPDLDSALEKLSE